MTERLCPQHYDYAPASSFLSDAPGAMCADCRARRGKRRSPAELRARLGRSPDARPRVIVVERSMNRKLGGIPTTLSSAETCPDACAWKGDGCFGEFSVLGYHWSRAATDGRSWGGALAWMRTLAPGQLWRHNTVGDLAGENDALDVEALDELVDAARSSRGFSFTAKPLRTLEERQAIARANDGGFTINLSARDVVHADARADLGVGPVACMVAGTTRTGDRTPAGRRIVVCPAELHDDVTCADCQLCRSAYRTGVVGFIPHGQLGQAIARRLPMAPRAPAFPITAPTGA